MVSIRKCINSAGPISRIQLPKVPQLDEEMVLGTNALSALECWQCRVGEVFTATDPQLSEYRARIVATDSSSVTLLPFAQVAATESPVRIELLQAMPSGRDS